jgi:predicted O-methyltransferase YrrM
MHNLLDQNSSSPNFFQHISQKQLKKTNVYSTREDFLLENLKQKSRIIEIGTLAGDFAYHILTEYDPEYLLLIDIFGQEDVGVYVNQTPPKKRFTAENHKDWVLERFKEYKNVEIKHSKGFQALSNYHKDLSKNSSWDSPDSLFDFIYLDSNHDFSNVLRELLTAEPLIKVGGVIGINDYMLNGIFTEEMFNNSEWKDVSYGTMQGASFFLNKFPNWRVMSIALNGAGNMDLFLQKESASVN